MASHQRPVMPERRRNNGGTSYRGSSSPYSRNGSVGTVKTSSSSKSRNATGRREETLQNDLDYLNYYNLVNFSSTNPGFDPSLYHDVNQQNASGLSGSVGPTSSSYDDFLIHQYVNLNAIYLADTPLQSPETFTYHPWDVAALSNSDANVQSNDTPISYGRSESYSSFDEGMVSTPDTLASAMSENNGRRGTSSVGSPTTNSIMLHDLKIPDEWYQSGQATLSAAAEDIELSSAEVTFNNDYDPGAQFWTDSGGCLTDNNPFQPNISMDQQLPEYQKSEGYLMQRQVPFTPQHTLYNMNASSGTVTFEPPRGGPLDVYHRRESLLNQSLQPSRINSQESNMMDEFDIDEQWQTPFQQESNLVINNDEFGQDIPRLHSHIFSAVPGVGVPKSQKVGVRKLTPEQKQRTREVRKCRACWACHLSKTKCSPCSRGSPCEQCTRLSGKRRVCQLSCFNDPIESLHIFLVPDYLMGHFTQANVESFVDKHTSKWGTRSIPVRLSWGFKSLLPVTVVELFPRDESSQIGYTHQSLSHKDGRPATLVCRVSPPLGIPQASPTEMQEEYCEYVRDVVVNHLDSYVSIAYDNQTSDLPRRLLQAVCSCYQMGVAANERCPLLQEALEIHVTSTILERCLVLDEASIDSVRAHLGRDFQQRSVPRCAQRQMKLAFFMGQQCRILRVLLKWGKLMHNMSSSDKRWTTAFCVLIVLMLVMDKTIAAAYEKCRVRIKFQGRDAQTEMEGYKTLLRLTETELFEKCKEIFHWRYKTRKGCNERFNPIRDGINAWRSEKLDKKTARFVEEMKSVVRDFGTCLPSGPSGPAGAGYPRQQPFSNLGQTGRDLPPASSPSSPASQGGETPYNNLGRLASIFLGDFLSVS